MPANAATPLLEELPNFIRLLRRDNFGKGTLAQAGVPFLIVSNRLRADEFQKAYENMASAARHCNAVLALDPDHWHIGLRMLMQKIAESALPIEWEQPGQGVSMRFTIDMNQKPELGVVKPMVSTSRNLYTFTVEPPRWPVLYAEILLQRDPPSDLEEFEVTSLVPAS